MASPLVPLASNELLLRRLPFRCVFDFGWMNTVRFKFVRRSRPTIFYVARPLVSSAKHRINPLQSRTTSSRCW